MSSETTEQFPVRNRWTNAVQFTAEITVTPDMLPSVKLGLAVRWGQRSDAVLRGADLRGAVLRPIKADFFMILAMGHKEVPGLIATLREGRVDRSTYTGSCACLVGTLENAGSAGIPHDPYSPAESWFAPIRKNVRPGDANEGGFRAAKALEWALEYCAATGIVLAEPEATKARGEA